MLVLGREWDKKELPDSLEVFEDVRLGYLKKGKHSFIFINKSKSRDDRIMGIYLNGKYGYRVINGDEHIIFQDSSIGGGGNSESKFGIYKVGTIIKEYTYKNRHSPSYYSLTKEGWKPIPMTDPLILLLEGDEIVEV